MEVIWKAYVDFGVSILALTQTVAKLPPLNLFNTLPCPSKYYWASSSRKHGDPWLIVDMAVVEFLAHGIGVGNGCRSWHLKTPLVWFGCHVVGRGCG